MKLLTGLQFRLFLPFLLFFTLVSVNFASADFKRTKIAILDFELIGNSFDESNLGAAISEWFITSIVKTGRFDVVERTLLNKILEEQKLGLTGVIDQQSASQIGQILGVNAIISGSVLKVSNSFEVNSRVINVENGSIIAAESIQCKSSRELRPSIKELTNKIISNFPLTGYIVKRSKNISTIDLGLNSGLTVGTEFEVYKEGDFIKHPRTGEILDIVRITTGRIRIIKIAKNIAQGEIINESNGGIKYGQLVKSTVCQNTGLNSSQQLNRKPDTASHLSSAPPPTSLTNDKSKVVYKSNKAKRPVVTLAPDTFDIAKINDILEHQRSGKYSHWINPATGNVFNAKANPAFSKKEDSSCPCRTIDISINGPKGRHHTVSDTYCRNSNGKWNKEHEKIR